MAENNEMCCCLSVTLIVMIGVVGLRQKQDHHSFLRFCVGYSRVDNQVGHTVVTRC